MKLSVARAGLARSARRCQRVAAAKLVNASTNRATAAASTTPAFLSAG